VSLAYEITKDAMRGYFEQTWGVWDEYEQVEKHRSNYTPGTHQIVLVGDKPAGLIAVEEEPEYLWLVKLYLLTPHRGNGIGTELLKRILTQSKNARKRVRLRVLRVNTKAQALYTRHGFRVVAESKERLFMAT
jgi:ribosomal protein S18 acetylase RimI-like enzyme